ncbi:hypothetical protein Dimus_028345 [Dionaea muscipula]
MEVDEFLGSLWLSRWRKEIMDAVLGDVSLGFWCGSLALTVSFWYSSTAFGKVCTASRLDGSRCRYLTLICGCWFSAGFAHSFDGDVGLLLDLLYGFLASMMGLQGWFCLCDIASYY